MGYETASKYFLKNKNNKRLRWVMSYDNWGGNKWGPILFMDRYKVQLFGNIGAASLFDADEEN